MRVGRGTRRAGGVPGHDPRPAAGGAEGSASAPPSLMASHRSAGDVRLWWGLLRWPSLVRPLCGPHWYGFLGGVFVWANTVTGWGVWRAWTISRSTRSAWSCGTWQVPAARWPPPPYV